MERLEFAKEQQKNIGYDPQILSVVPSWVIIGKGCYIYENVLLGTEGFGYAQDTDINEWIHIPHMGNLIIGNNVDIFPYTTVNRGTVKNTIICSGTKIDHHCHIGHNSYIGKNCMICAGVIICGSVFIGDNVWIGAGAMIKQKISIGEGACIGLGAVVVKDVDPGDIVAGNPAKTFK